MVRKARLMILLLTLIACPALQAQDDDKPTIAILRLGTSPVVNLVEKGFLDVLEVYEFVDAEERALLNDAEDLEGENLNVIYGDANADLPTANLIIEKALDQGADALFTISTNIAQIAANITRGMDDPPIVLFSLVSTLADGIADAACVKPDHVAGSRVIVPYHEYVDLLPLFNPDLKVVGTLVSPAQPNSVYGVNQITEYAQELGMTVEVVSVTAFPDLPLGIEALISKGAEAVVLPGDYLMGIGMPAMVAAASEHAVPVFSHYPGSVFRGATVGAGFFSIYQEGVTAARMLIAHLNGEVDIATLGISQTSGFAVAINLDSAAAADIEIRDELLAQADFVIKDGQSSAGVTPALPEVATELPEMTLDERRAADLEFLAALECTDEMIAEQQAALEE